MTVQDRPGGDEQRRPTGQGEMREATKSARGERLLRVANVETGKGERDIARPGCDDRRSQPDAGDRGDRAEKDEGVTAEQLRGDEHRQEECRRLGYRGLLVGDGCSHEHTDHERPARDPARMVARIAPENPDQNNGAGP